MARRAEDADAAAPVPERRGGRRSPHKTNPLLRADRAAWLAGQWSGPTGNGDERALLADANHKRASPLNAQVDDWLEFYKRITAPLLWVEGDRSDISVWWGDRYTKAEFHERLASSRDASGTSSARPATCCTTTGPRTSPGC